MLNLVRGGEKCKIKRYQRLPGELPRKTPDFTLPFELLGIKRMLVYRGKNL